jgi:hypothetical protein
MLLVPAAAFAWGCLELPTKVRRDACWEKLQAEAQKPSTPEQKAIEAQNANEARVRLDADKQQLREALAVRARKDQLDREERLAREFAFAKSQQYQTVAATTPRLVTRYGAPLIYPMPINHHFPRTVRNHGTARRL